MTHSFFLCHHGIAVWNISTIPSIHTNIFILYVIYGIHKWEARETKKNINLWIRWNHWMWNKKNRICWILCSTWQFFPTVCIFFSFLCSVLHSTCFRLKLLCLFSRYKNYERSSTQKIRYVILCECSGDLWKKHQFIRFCIL